MNHDPPCYSTFACFSSPLNRSSRIIRSPMPCSRPHLFFTLCSRPVWNPRQKSHRRKHFIPVCPRGFHFIDAPYNQRQLLFLNHFCFEGNLFYRKMSNITTVVFPERFDWYMIRNGYLGPDYSSKIGSFIIAVVLILYDGLTRKRLDYLWAMIVGTALWVLLEWCLIVSGVREYQEGYLGGKLLGFWPALIIRCSQECGFLMVSTMFQGDRLFNCMKGKKSPFKTWRRMVEFIVVFLLLSLSGAVNMLSGAKDERMVGSADVFGRRNMTHIVSVLLFLITTIVPIVLCIVLRNKKYFMRRTIGITLFVTWISGLGMVIEYTHNARWIEVGHYPEYIALPTSGHMLLAFLYDLIIEVVSPPVFIYHLMVLCYILPDLKKDTYYDEKPAVELPVTKPDAAVNVPAPTEAPVFKGPEDLSCVC